MAPSGAPAASASPILDAERAGLAEPLPSLSTERSPASGDDLRGIGRIRASRGHDDRIGLRGRPGLDLLDLRGELLDTPGQRVDLVAARHAEAVQGLGEHLVELLVPGLEGPLGPVLGLV